MNPTKNRGWTRVLRKDRKFHIHLWHPLWKEICLFVNIEGISIVSVYCVWFFVSSVKLNQLNCWSKLCLHSLLFSVCLCSEIVDRQSHMPWACYVNLFLSDLLNVDREFITGYNTTVVISDATELLTFPRTSEFTTLYFVAHYLVICVVLCKPFIVFLWRFISN